MATFRNVSTGQVVDVPEDHPSYKRRVRMDRWELVEPEPVAPAGIAADVDMSANIPTILEAVGSDAAKAQAVMEAEASADNPRSTLMEALAQIVAGSEEE